MSAYRENRQQKQMIFFFLILVGSICASFGADDNQNIPAPWATALEDLASKYRVPPNTDIDDLLKLTVTGNEKEREWATFHLSSVIQQKGQEASRAVSALLQYSQENLQKPNLDRMPAALERISIDITPYVFDWLESRNGNAIEEKERDGVLCESHIAMAYLSNHRKAALKTAKLRYNAESKFYRYVEFLENEHEQYLREHQIPFEQAKTNSLELLNSAQKNDVALGVEIAVRFGLRETNQTFIHDYLYSSSDLIKIRTAGALMRYTDLSWAKKEDLPLGIVKLLLQNGGTPENTERVLRILKQTRNPQEILSLTDNLFLFRASPESREVISKFFIEFAKQNQIDPIKILDFFDSSGISPTTDMVKMFKIDRQYDISEKTKLIKYFLRDPETRAYAISLSLSDGKLFSTFVRQISSYGPPTNLEAQDKAAIVKICQSWLKSAKSARFGLDVLLKLKLDNAYAEEYLLKNPLFSDTIKQYILEMPNFKTRLKAAMLNMDFEGIKDSAPLYLAKAVGIHPAPKKLKHLLEKTSDPEIRRFCRAELGIDRPLAIADFTNDDPIMVAAMKDFENKLQQESVSKEYIQQLGAKMLTGEWDPSMFSEVAIKYPGTDPEIPKILALELIKRKSSYGLYELIEEFKLPNKFMSAYCSLVYDSALIPVENEKFRSRVEAARRWLDVPKLLAGGPQEIPAKYHSVSETVTVDNGLQPFWPPPANHAGYDTFAVGSLGEKSDNLFEAHLKLIDILKKADYEQNSFFKAPGGFSLLTSIERIEPDFSPATGDRRWEHGRENPRGMFEFIKRLFYEEPGKFRCFYIAVTNEASIPAREQLRSMPTADLWAKSGPRYLDESFKSISLNGLHCHIAVFCFEKFIGGNIEYVESVPVPVVKQLQRSKLGDLTGR